MESIFTIIIKIILFPWGMFFKNMKLGGGVKMAEE